MKRGNEVDAVVAGHGCLDIKPLFPTTFMAEKLFQPGSLTILHPAQFTLGGTIKVGPVLDRLGVSTTVMGAYGNDEWGSILLQLLQQNQPQLANEMIKIRGESTSYSLVIQPPGLDRAFGHHPGINDRFIPDWLDYGKIRKARLFLFGYLTLMREMFLNHGKNAHKMFARIHGKQTTTVLDITEIDRSSEVGQQDWDLILTRVLPHVDIFIPSYREILRLLDIKIPETGTNMESVALAASKLLDKGVAIVGIKLGELGCYLRVTEDKNRLLEAGRALTARQIDQFLGRELFVPAFTVDGDNTNGAGDYWYAGFLAAILRGMSLEQAACLGNACGAFRVTSTDPNQLSPSFRGLQLEMKQWPVATKLPAAVALWTVDASTSSNLPVYIGKRDIRFADK